MENLDDENMTSNEAIVAMVECIRAKRHKLIGLRWEWPG